MHYFSTNLSSPVATFKEAVLNGQPDDGGLYFPSEIPQLSAEKLASIAETDNADIAFQIIRPYVAGDIEDDNLYQICSETVDFPFPLVRITENISALELFHGPTYAFKDVGARFMSRCLRQFAAEKQEKAIVIVATSGDTGGAVANGFAGVDGVEVIILYPKNKVSRLQEQQLTTLGGNVTTLELHGDFDDCQKLAKQALADNDLRSRVFLTSANSINVARWLPQQFYYFFAAKQAPGCVPVFSVPSGNFGNICAGMVAAASGLPAKRFIAACNANDVVPRFLTTEVYEPAAAVATLSNAMDVGDPSNFVRVMQLFGHDVIRLREFVSAVRVSDEETAVIMRQVHAKYGYVLDPHGAVAFYALSKYLDAHPGQKGVFLETAHPVKFDSVETIIGSYGEMPAGVDELMKRKKVSIEAEVDYDILRQVIESKI